ncbi:MAG: T9SS type A sorting domain-containing protein [Bacteroidales bacterium]|nr:T9SS type A sorting domain-containing protein [Bacteroidales bacterium]
MSFRKYLNIVYTILFGFTLVFSVEAQELRILPLGNSITRGSMCTNGDIYNCVHLPDAQAIGYRHRLITLMNNAGYDFDFIGNYKYGYGTMSDPDNAGFSAIRDNWLADIMETGTSTHTGQVTPGPFLNYYPTDIILLHIGTNDVSAGDYYVNDVERILEAIDDYEDANGEPILVFLARIISRQNKSCNTDYGTKTFNNRLVSMAQSRINNGDHVVIVDMECGAGINYYTDIIDQVHPNQTGYDKMADKWFEAIENYNSAPSVSQIPDQAIDRGGQFSQITLDNFVTDAEDNPQDITWSVFPESPQHFSITIDENRVATISPLHSDWSGSETIEFVATDRGRVITSLQRSDNCLTQFTINWTPEIIGQQPLFTPEGTSLEISLDDLIIVEPDKAPAGLELIVEAGNNYTVASHTITPDQYFFGQLTVPVKIVADAKESDTYYLDVEVTDVNHPPVITSSPVLSAKAGDQYVYTLVADDEDPGDVLSYSAIEKPTWLQINENTGLVTGTPSINDTGFPSIKLRVYDGEYEDVQSYTLEVLAYNLPPVVVTEPKDTAIVAKTYTYGIQANDPEDATLFYFAKTVPEWLVFYPSTQVLIGVPDYEDVGENLVVLCVSDQNDTTYQAFVINVTFASYIGEPELHEINLVYPNPATHQLFINLNELPNIQNGVIFELFDLTGKKVIHKELGDPHSEIRLLGIGLNDGVYLYRLTDRALRVPLHTGKLLLRLSGE